MSSIIQDNIRKTMNNTATNYLPYILIALIVLFFLNYIVNKITLNQSNCLNLKNLYTSPPNIKNIDFTKNDYKHQLRDYYVKSSYNSCCSGQFKNDYVSICALENVLKNGARFLDFEIYAKDDKPIIAASSSAEFSYKEMYNHVEFEEAMKKIRDIAFTDVTPNHDDPLILNFRIKTNSIQAHDLMAKDIYYSFGRNFLNGSYKFENQGNNLGEVYLKDLKRTILISVDRSNSTYKSTKLYSYVNIASGGSFLRTYRNYDVEYSTNIEDITNFNKGNMAIVLPDYNATNENKSHMIAKESGVQIIAMNFQKFDAAFKMYSLLFDAAGSAFILKPDHLRFHDVTLDDPSESTSLPDGSADYNCNETDSYRFSGVDFASSYSSQETQDGSTGTTTTSTPTFDMYRDRQNDNTQLYIQYSVNNTANCNKQKGYVNDIIGNEEADEIENLTETPDFKYFNDEYRINDEAGGPFPREDKLDTQKHWLANDKDWGDWYCQQYQDETGKCERKTVNKNNGLIQCRKAKWGHGDYDRIKIKNKWSDKKKKKMKKENKNRKNNAKASYWKDHWILKKKNQRKFFFKWMYQDYNDWWLKILSNFPHFSPFMFKGERMRYNTNKNLYEVNNCDDYSGILGLHNDGTTSMSSLWKDLYGTDKTSIKKYSRQKMMNEEEEIYKRAQHHCSRAVYGYDHNSNPLQCKYIGVKNKATNISKDLNKEFLDGKTSMTDETGIMAKPFWDIKCGESGEAFDFNEGNEDDAADFNLDDPPPEVPS
jgi:hypothetical protein